EAQQLALTGRDQGALARAAPFEQELPLEHGPERQRRRGEEGPGAVAVGRRRDDRADDLPEADDRRRAERRAADDAETLAAPQHRARLVAHSPADVARAAVENAF